MKTITLDRNDAHRAGLPAFTQVQIEPTKNKNYPGHYDVYHQGRKIATMQIEGINGQ